MAPTIEAAQEQLTEKVMSLPGVVGTAIGERKGKPCIKVFVLEKTEELLSRIPSTFAGFPVVIEASGVIRARPR